MCKLNCGFNGIYRFRTSWSAASEQLRAAKLVRTAMYSRVMVLSAPIRWPSVYVVHAVNWMHVRWADKRGIFKTTYNAGGSCHDLEVFRNSSHCGPNRGNEGRRDKGDVASAFRRKSSKYSQRYE
jgi:hypothetical protein